MLDLLDTFLKGTDRENDPVEWNQAWDRYFEFKFRKLPEYPPSPFRKQGQSFLSQDVLSYLVETRKELCKLQFDLACFIASKRENDHFDAKWLKMPAESRENYMLQGLVISCGVPDMPERRAWCPETTMKFLQDDGGRGFLNLLATVCPPSVTEPQLASEPILISHPIHDAMLHIGEPSPPDGSEAATSLLQNISVNNRNLFIAFFLWNTVYYIYGKSQEYGVIRGTGGSRTNDRRLQREDLPMDKQQRKGIQKEHNEVFKIAKWHCSNCYKLEDSPGGRKLLDCSKCKLVGRKIKYCDRECQLNDWKKGNPPHKVICGKPLDVPGPVLLTNVQSAQAPSINSLEEAKIGPPPPDPGFVRSKELQEQVSFLQRYPKASYGLLEPAPKDDISIRIPGVMAARRFEIWKESAMRNGDPRSVVLMYDMLQAYAKIAHFSDDRLLLQLSKEYGISIDGLIGLHKVVMGELEHLNDGKGDNTHSKTTNAKLADVSRKTKVAPVQEPIAAPSSSSTNVGPPHSKSGFVRSEALLRQITFLKENPGASYALMVPAPKGPIGIRVPKDKGGTLFDIMRKRAISSGDPRTVAILYDGLKEVIKFTDFSNERLLLQLSEEYGITVSELVNMHKIVVDENPRMSGNAPQKTTHG